MNCNHICKILGHDIARRLTEGETLYTIQDHRRYKDLPANKLAELEGYTIIHAEPVNMPHPDGVVLYLLARDGSMIILSVDAWEDCEHENEGSITTDYITISQDELRELAYSARGART